MNKHLPVLITLLTFGSFGVVGEELTFKCNWKSNDKYLPRTRDFIPYGSTGWTSSDIDNLCTQKRFEETARTGRNNDYAWEDDFCLNDEVTEIKINTEEKTFKIDSWAYKTVKDNSNRRCFGSEDKKLCEYETSSFSLDDDALRIWVKTTYQLPECPIGLTLEKAFKEEDESLRKSYFHSCLGMIDGDNDFQNDLEGSSLFITIDRSTLDFRQLSSKNRITFENGSFVKEIFKSGKFDGNFSDSAEETGTCKVFRKQF